MRMKFLVMLFPSLFLAVLFSQHATHAGIYRLGIDVLTSVNANQSTGEADPDSQQVCADIYVQDTMYRGPDAVKTLTVSAPDNTTFTFSGTNTPNLGWLEFCDEFWFCAKANKFPAGELPPGKYSATAIDKAGKKLTRSETLSVEFLGVPKILSPIEGETVTSLSPTVSWTAITGASYYRIFISRVYADGSVDPVYTIKPKDIKVSRSSFTIPRGVLWPQSTYLIRIEARDSDLNLNKRSRSKYVHFYTP